MLGVPLSETFNVKLFVEFACVTSGRNENAPSLVLRVAFVAPASSANVRICGGWFESVALAVNATVWPTLTVRLVIAASTGGVLVGPVRVRAMVFVWLINPAVAMTVTFVVPEVTLLEAVSVSRLAPPVDRKR